MMFSLLVHNLFHYVKFILILKSIMFGCFFLYRVNVVRWCIIGVAAVAAGFVAYKYRAMILKVLKKKFKKKKKTTGETA